MNNKARKCVFLHSAELEKYSYPPDCPFNTSRATLARQTLLSMGLIGAPDRIEAPPVSATRQDLEKFHEPRYLDALRRAGAGDLDADGLNMGLGSADCPVFKGMYEYAALAAGGTITAARLILSREAAVAFNPSGGFHHAGPAKASGFCYVNDVVLGAMSLAEAGERTLILDLDAHHCDGVQDAFYARKDVMTISMHESGETLFPGAGFEDEIGSGEGEGYTVNIPLPAGTYDGAYISVFDAVALPLMKAFDPDVIMVELGMDTLAGDPLTHMHLTNNVHAHIIGELLEFNRPILAVGGGGYHVENTARGWCLAWSVLVGEHVEDMSSGMGGVMLGNRDWSGGLLDRVALSTSDLRNKVDRHVNNAIKKLRATVFPLHGL